MPKLSVISTLVEAFWIGWSRRRLILLLGVIGAIPSGLMAAVMLWLVPMPVPPAANATPSVVQAEAAQAVTDSLLITLYSLLSVAILFLITAVSTAALLGVLKTDPSPANLWSTIKASIRAYTWPFIIVSFLLTIVACAMMIPFTLVVAAFAATVVAPASHAPVAPNYFVEFFVILMGILYLIFVKYALVNPVLVLENLRPIEALKKSWQMTRGFFWYVLGCYVFLGTAEYGIDAFFQLFQKPTSFNWANAVGLFVSSMFQLYWLLLAWSMYHQIKAAEHLIVESDLPATKAEIDL